MGKLVDATVAFVMVVAGLLGILFGTLMILDATGQLDFFESGCRAVACCERRY